MSIWMRHPNHGVKVCYLEGEAIADEKNGWERFDPNARVEHAQTAKVAPAEQTHQAKKRGRPFKSQ